MTGVNFKVHNALILNLMETIYSAALMHELAKEDSTFQEKVWCLLGMTNKN
jgi:hypothetical protein